MSEFSAKTIRAARKAKASRMGSADPHTKVDSSDWTPAEPLNADVKTGARPISRRAFKSGGKVCGEKAKANMGRAPRKAGGVAAKDYANAKVNRNVKDANEEREGIKHVGGFKKGGRAKREYGGRGPGERTQHEMKRRDATQAATDYGADPRVTEDVLRQKTRAFEKSAEQTAYKKGGRTKKMDGGAMMPGMAPMAGPDPRLGMVSPNRMKFAGPQGSPYKKGGKVEHGDEAMDKALIKKMVKPSARTGKSKGGGMPLKGHPYHSKSDAELRYIAKDAAAAAKNMRGMDDKAESKYLDQINDASTVLGYRQRGGKKITTPSKDDDTFMNKGGRTARATGGKVKKGKTNINIVINAGKKDDGGMGMPPPPPGLPGGPGGPMSLQRPMGGMPPGMPPMPPGMPAGGPPGMGQPPMPPMARKSGGRITKVARSYKDMEAGAASGEGRLQKTDIAKRIPKKKEDGVIETDKRGYPNKVIGATGGRTAHKAGGKVYRSYKDMDAGAGSGMGRLEKEEIQKRKH